MDIVNIDSKEFVTLSSLSLIFENMWKERDLTFIYLRKSLCFQIYWTFFGKIS